jgi:hypothetical protein
MLLETFTYFCFYLRDIFNTSMHTVWNFGAWMIFMHRLCVLAVRVPGYRSRGHGSIPDTIRFSEKLWVWNGVHLASEVQLRSYLKEKVAAQV